jgi:hypothetical protein
MSTISTKVATAVAGAIALAGLAAGPVSAASPGASADTSAAVQPTAAPTAAREWHNRNAALVKRNWGVDIVGVKPVSSGYMLGFRYRIVDAEKARLLNERKKKAYLVDEASGTVLAVPAMENIGELRSSTTPQTDRVYFMIFGNPGKLVKPGSKVTVVAGDFRIQGLVVE